MTAQNIISMASSQVGYHEKVTNTPSPDLYPFRNSYDGFDNWTKYHHDIHQVDASIMQGAAWCGYFLYWCYLQLLQTKAATDAFLKGISGCGGAVSSWANAFTPYGQYHEGDAYTPSPGDIVIFSDTGYPWSHVEIIVDVSDWPTYIETIGGNTRNPDEGGDQSQGMWVARRRRYAQGTTGFHVRGYCEVIYDDSPILAGIFIKRRRRIGTAFG